jgi:hypothetical protein
MWVRGEIDGRHYKESLKTRSWERAEALKREIEQGCAKAPVMSVSDAKNAYLLDCAARSLSQNTQTKLKLVLGELEQTFRGELLKAVTFARLLNFRASWQGSDITKLKKLERLKAFFRYCHDAGWTSVNPARNLKPRRSGSSRKTLTPTMSWTGSTKRSRGPETRSSRSSRKSFATRRSGSPTWRCSRPNICSGTRSS